MLNTRGWAESFAGRDHGSVPAIPLKSVVDTELKHRVLAPFLNSQKKRKVSIKHVYISWAYGDCYVKKFYSCKVELNGSDPVFA